MSNPSPKSIIWDEGFHYIVILDADPTHDELENTVVGIFDSGKFSVEAWPRYRRIATGVPIAGMDDVDQSCTDLCVGSKLENNAIVYRIFPSAWQCKRAGFTAVDSADRTLCLKSWADYLEYVNHRAVPRTQ